MKIELKKINEPNGKYWYGIWVDGSCQIPSFGADFEAARAEYNNIIELAKEPKEREEIIQSETI